MLQNWLDGKKKYSAFLITIFTVIISSINITPDTKAEISSYIPMLAAIISGIAYIIVQGKIDNNKVVAATNGTAAVAAPPTTKKVTAGTTQQMESAPKIEAVVFDAGGFDALVEDKAKRDYLEANDITRYFAAQDLGNTTRWASLYHTLAYQDYMVAKAMKAFEVKFGFPYTEADKHLADDLKCPYYSVDNMARQKGIDFWFMLRMVRQTIAKAQELGTT